jgi:2-polyprenyl-3-methyl-5-hydroxy-6-metoxy-1,4-benzoquinol methylase
MLTKFELTMLRCNDCGLIFTHPQPPSAQVAARYSRAWFEMEYLPSFGVDPVRPNLARFSKRSDRLLKKLSRFRFRNELLDVGAGVGLTLARAKHAGWNVAGVELSEFGPQFALKHFGIDIMRGTLEEVQFPSNYFDVVLLQDTIEHVPDPRATLQEISRILRPGGALILSTPNYSGVARVIAGIEWALISPAEHLFLFSPKSLSAVLRTCGLEPTSLTSSASVNPRLLSEIKKAQAARYAKSIVLHAVAFLGWKPFVKLFGLGDELFCTAIKPE